MKLERKLNSQPNEPIIIYHHYHHVFWPKAGPSLQHQAPRLQFCPKAGLPLQTQEPRLQFY